jgi:hypothetical protein
VGFEVIAAVKITVFWDVTLDTHLEEDGNVFLRNAGMFLPNYEASHSILK